MQNLPQSRQSKQQQSASHQNSHQEFDIQSFMMSRKKLVDAYLLSREYSELISDADQLQLRKIERIQTAYSALCCTVFLSCLGIRHFKSARYYSQLYPQNIVFQGFSRMPYFLAHVTSAYLLTLSTYQADKIAMQKSMEIISKYDPVAEHLVKFNQIIQ